MLLTIIVIIYNLRPIVPASFLSLSIIPYVTCSLLLHASGIILPKRQIENIDNKMFSTYMKICLFVFENCSNVKIYVYGDYDEIIKKEEKAIVLSNHQSSADWVVFSILSNRQNTDYGLRFIVKASLQYVPLFAWYVYQRGFVFVRRFGSFVLDPVERQLNYLSTLGSPYWLCIFPEGTRFNAKSFTSIDKTHDWCIQQGIRAFMNVGRPYSKAFTLSFNNLNQHIDAVYDITIGYNSTDKMPIRGEPLNMFDLCLKAAENKSIHIYIKKHHPDSIPRSMSGHKVFMIKSFEEKELLMEKFYETGNFSDQSGKLLETISLLETLPCVVLYTLPIIASFYSSNVRKCYLTSLALSPFLILWTRLYRKL
ncbi:1-acyl-sn-glycerol-3-phosphate acyltransferase epsilon [Strongyloides ratti]|uniref:1-acyl-sn-glycerol-3-phosphate acyltransferase epsilon n=1 Tax=Strongyloides ratti TaxID=34506 RepID=A0A090MZ88_STRRB|nr:1-acyl-sn-glycerol-3-phosphate acyltransferase epsilon [Strongyloides ratti]CEF68509.1 1-acyl-sn-glycerol-3-phosphate acyltransferase epsilon [Strongyloides ratti]